MVYTLSAVSTACSYLPGRPRLKPTQRPPPQPQVQSYVVWSPSPPSRSASNLPGRSWQLNGSSLGMGCSIKKRPAANNRTTRSSTGIQGAATRPVLGPRKGSFVVLRVNSDFGGQYEVLDVNGGTCCLHLKDSLRSKLEQVPTSPPASDSRLFGG